MSKQLKFPFWVANNGAYKDFILDIGDYSFLDTDQYLIGANDSYKAVEKSSLIK